MPLTGLEKSFGKKSINESYRSIQIGTPLTRTTSTSILECRQKHLNFSTWQPPILEVDYRLPTIEVPKTDSAAFRSITAQTLHDLLVSRTQEEFNREFILLDCRYHFEYNGGHIKYSINFFDPDKVQSLFYPEEEEKFEEVCTRVPIFYCEYSQARGPNMAHSLRRFDRRRNEAAYPIVDYPEMYLLDGGYKNFYEHFKRLNVCIPDRYVPMNTKRFRGVLKKFKFHKNKVHRNNRNNNHLEMNANSFVISRKRKLVIREQHSRKKILCGGPMMTSTPRRPGDQGKLSSLIEQELAQIPSWRSSMNGFPSTSEWDSSFDTSLTELESSSVFEDQISAVERSFGQSNAIMALDLNSSSQHSCQQLRLDSDTSSLM